jgi:hypothetical protein
MDVGRPYHLQQVPKWIAEALKRNFKLLAVFYRNVEGDPYQSHFIMLIPKESSLFRAFSYPNPNQAVLMMIQEIVSDVLMRRGLPGGMLEVLADGCFDGLCQAQVWLTLGPAPPPPML